MRSFPELQERIRAIRLPSKRIVALGLLSLLAGIYVRNHAAQLGEWKDALAAACDALLIAAFLSIAVDPVLKRELVTDAAKDIFWYAFGYSLPDELRAFMNNLLLKSKVVRRDCRLRWHFEPTPDQSGKVQVNLDASFAIVNFSDEDVDYQHKVFAWKENEDDVAAIRAMYCTCSDPEGSHYSNEDPKGLASGKDGFIVGQPIKLVRRTKRDRYRVGAIYYTEGQQPGLDQFSIVETTMEIEVIAVVHESLRHLAFSVVPDLSGKRDSENFIAPTWNPITKKFQCSWTLDRVFVQNERVLIRWRHREREVPAFQSLD